MYHVFAASTNDLLLFYPSALPIRCIFSARLSMTTTTRHRQTKNASRWFLSFFFTLLRPRVIFKAMLDCVLNWEWPLVCRVHCIHIVWCKITFVSTCYGLVIGTNVYVCTYWEKCIVYTYVVYILYVLSREYSIIG